MAIRFDGGVNVVLTRGVNAVLTGGVNAVLTDKAIHPPKVERLNVGQATTMPLKASRKGDRHKPGYLRDYMRRRRAAARVLVHSLV